MADYTVNAQNREQLFDELKKLPTKVGDTVRWNNEDFVKALKIKSGIPLENKTDTSPNRGSGWMGKR